MHRKLLYSLLSTLCLMCLFSSGSYAETATLDGIRYEIKDGYAVLAGFVESAESVTVHTVVNGYQTQYFWDGEQAENLTVKEVVVGSEITDLEQVSDFRSLLYMCNAVERIVLPASLTIIGENLSYTNDSLQEIVVAQGNPVYRAIDGVLFDNRGKMLLIFPGGRSDQYDIPAGTESIGKGAFGYNERLLRLTIPEGITRLEADALWSLRVLREITLPASLEWIDNGALPSGGALERIIVADHNLHYQSVDGVVFSKDGKTLVIFPSGRGGHYDIPPGTTAIMNSAFGSNTSLESLTVPEGITELSDGAFSQLYGLTQLFLPASLQSIGEMALPGYGVLKQIVAANGNEHYQTYDGALFSRDGKTLLLFPAGRGGKYEIPPGTMFIDKNAFGVNENLVSVTVPDGVTTLPQGLLSAASGLEEIYLPTTIKEIGENALPTYGVFQRVEVVKGNQRYNSIDGVLFEGGELIFYPLCHGLSYDVPAGTTRIRQGVFSNSGILETISIPRSVTEIGADTFYRCTALARVSLPITLTKIGRSAFENCISLSSIILPPGLTVLENSAFYNCPSLEQIHIPDGVTELGTFVFKDHNPKFVLFALKGSSGYWHAWEYDILWAEPYGTPGFVRPTDRQTQTAVVNNPSNLETLDLSAKPSTGAKSLGKYPNGTTLQVLDTKDDWAHVLMYGAEGYMPLESLMFTDKLNNLIHITWGRKRKDMAGRLRLYTEPSQEATSEVVIEDVSMRILDTVGVWYRVLIQGHEGYVPVQNLSVVHRRLLNYDEGNTGYFVVANPKPQDRLHLREEPSTKSSSLGRYFNGTQVEALDLSQDGWVHVRVDGKEGYMMVQYLISIDSGGEPNLWGHG